jgi:hypothetical protein
MIKKDCNCFNDANKGIFLYGNFKNTISRRSIQAFLVNFHKSYFTSIKPFHDPVKQIGFLHFHDQTILFAQAGKRILLLDESSWSSVFDLTPFENVVCFALIYNNTRFVIVQPNKISIVVQKSQKGS